MNSPLINASDTAALAHLFPLTVLFNQNNTKDGCITACLLVNSTDAAAGWRLFYFPDKTQLDVIRRSLQYLSVAVEGSVVQGGAPAAVRHIDAAQQRDDDLSAAQWIIGCSDVQRRLPVLVPSVHVRWVTDQNSHRLLRKKVIESRNSCCWYHECTSLVQICSKCVS